MCTDPEEHRYEVAAAHHIISDPKESLKGRDFPKSKKE